MAQRAQSHSLTPSSPQGNLSAPDLAGPTLTTRNPHDLAGREGFVFRLARATGVMLSAMNPRSIFNAEIQELFLDDLRKHGNPTDAAHLCGVPVSTPKRLRSADPSFAEAWDAALEEFYDGVEAEAVHRAVQGVLEPVHYKGEVVDHVTRKSDALLMFLLKARRRNVFGERSQVELTGRDGEPLLMTEAEKAARMAQLLETAAANRKLIDG